MPQRRQTRHTHIPLIPVIPLPFGLPVPLAMARVCTWIWYDSFNFQVPGFDSDSFFLKLSSRFLFSGLSQLVTHTRPDVPLHGLFLKTNRRSNFSQKFFRTFSSFLKNLNSFNTLKSSSSRPPPHRLFFFPILRVDPPPTS